MSNSLRRTVVLIDLSGTLHVEDTATDGAVEALNRLLDSPNKYAVKFVTNTTKVRDSMRLVNRPLQIVGVHQQSTRTTASLRLQPYRENANIHLTVGSTTAH